MRELERHLRYNDHRFKLKRNIFYRVISDGLYVLTAAQVRLHLSRARGVGHWWDLVLSTFFQLTQSVECCYIRKLTEALLTFNSLKAETHYATDRCYTSPRQVAATKKLPRVTCGNHCCCDLSHEFKIKLVWIRATYCSHVKISPSGLVASYVRFCDKRLRQNLNQPIGAGDCVEFEVFIFPLPNLLACTDQVSCCSSYADQMTCRRDMSQRFDAAIWRTVCLGLNN